MAAGRSNQPEVSDTPQFRYHRHFLIAAFVISGISFAVDLATPRGVAAGVFPHLLAIALLTWTAHRRAPYVLAALASLFSLAGFALTEGGNPDIILMNRGFLIVSYWVMAFVVARKLASDQRFQKSHARVERALDSQAAELESEIEQRLQTQDSLERAEIGLRLIIDRLPALVAYVDADQRYRFTNAYYDKFFGVTSTQPFGQHVRSVLGEAAYEYAAPNISQALAGQVVKCTLDLPTPQGASSFNVTYVPDLDDDGAVRGFVVLALDVTEEQRLLQMLMQSQRLEAVGQLTGGIAHDFNNLLAVVIGRLELLLETFAPDDSRVAQVQMALKAGERGATLTRQLLAFSRQQPLQPRPVEARHIVAGALEMLGRTLGEQIEIEIVSAPNLWLCEVDPAQLESAIVNLALNARDAMASGGKLTIELANAQLAEAYAAQQSEVRPGAYVVISVSDNGTGMDEKTRRRVFEPFFTTKEPGKGSGLGLAMVYGFVKQSHGHVSVYSELGHGTTFRIYLPRADAKPDDLSPPLDDGDLMGQGERILVVEDDEGICELVVAQLGGLGYRIATANSGRAALERLRADEFDLLLTDLVLPGGMNGRRVAEAATALQPSLRVLYMSGYSENAVIHHDRVDPGVRLLQKPFHRAELARAVRRALSDTPD